MSTLREDLKALIDQLDEHHVEAIYTVVAELLTPRGTLSPERAALLDDILRERRPLLDALAREARTAER